MLSAPQTVVFPNRYGDGVGARQRAVTEAAVCCSLVHPNVVSTFHYDIKPVHAGASVSASKFGEHGKGLEVEMSSADHMMDYKLFLVQELCVASVTDLLADGHFHFSSMDDSSSSPLSLQGLPKAKLYKIFCLLENVAQGMEYIHNMALLHGDIKPQNIMVKRDRTQPWGYLAKMTDFGIAIVMTDSSGSKLSHVSNFGAGTPFYCAPEITYLGQASTASDVYSFGVLMIETFTSLSPAVLYERYCKDNLRGQGQAAATESRDKLRPSEYLLKVLLCEEQGGVVGEDWPSHTCFESFKDLALQCLQEDSMARPSFSAIVKEVKRMKAEYPPELIDQEYEVSEK